MEKIKVYTFSTIRNKSGVNGVSARLQKKEIFNITGGKCYLCKETFEINRFELEHKIPVEIGGLIFDKTNLELCCKKCHLKKTYVDKRVINLIKKLGIIPSKGMSFMPLKDLKELYLNFFKLCYESKEKYEKWWNGTNEIDYIQVMENYNRRVMEE